MVDQKSVLGVSTLDLKLVWRIWQEIFPVRKNISPQHLAIHIEGYDRRFFLRGKMFLHNT
jgi:hypothetical protein